MAANSAAERQGRVPKTEVEGREATVVAEIGVDSRLLASRLPANHVRLLAHLAKGDFVNKITKLLSSYVAQPLLFEAGGRF